jgi:hypothetical protein
MVPGVLDPEMIEDTAKIVNEAIKDKVLLGRGTRHLRR